uniref:B-cell receptor CD22 n=1 Tax=Electrophorus electricus TaxID=8005 RepID=A0A4W4DTW9_ELEEL
MDTVWRIFYLLVTLCLNIALTNKITIQEEAATKQEGLCVTINCTHDFQEMKYMLWFKDAIWNGEKFEGTIVYSNKPDQPQASEYSGRVEFLSQDQGSCSLRINHLQKNDSGAYQFRLIDQGYRYMSKMNMSLTVKDNPCKIDLKSSGPVKEHDTVTLRCSTSKQCGFAPEWDPSSINAPISVTDDKHISELKLNVSWLDNGRTLSCHLAKSKDGCLARNVTLAVEYAPKDTKVDVKSKDVKEGESVTISCSSKANPNAAFTWFKVNQSEPFLSSDMFTLDSAKQIHSGIYYCQANNKYGKEDSQTFAINVTYAPKEVQAKLEPADVKVGDSLTLKCLVHDSNPSVMPGSFRWYKDGSDTANYSNTLFIQNVEKKHKGWYHCQAKNYVGVADSNKIEVSVKYRPQDTYIDGKVTVKLHLSLNLTCVSDANPEPSDYSWFHKPEHGKNYVERSRTLREYLVENVTIQDAGWYMCSPRNVIGMGSNSTAFRLKVLYAPKLPKLTMAKVLNEYELLTVSCTVESSPVANITLNLTNPGNKPVELVRNQSNTLKFFVNASKSTAGQYTCTAQNTEGENSITEQLKVLYAPKNVHVQTQPGQELKEGNHLMLSCEAHSEPSVSSYTWEKLSEAHRETAGQGKTLTIHPLNASHSGDYICIARNNLGINQSAPVHIRVKYRPSTKIIHNITYMSSMWAQTLPVHLTCSVQCDPPATSYAWYRLEDNTTALSTHQNYTVHPQSPGIYYCSAKNDIGMGTSERVELFLNPLLKLFQVLIPVFSICFVIAGVFLLCRFLLRKRASEQDDNSSFFFSETLSRSSTVANFLSLISQNNNRENLMMEREVSSQLRDHQSLATALHGSPSRDTTVAIHTVYDFAQLPQTMQKGLPSTEGIPTTTSTNFATLQFKNKSNPNKSEPNTDSGPVYAVVSKDMQNTKTAESDSGDYENISGANAQKPAATYMNWDSDTSEEEEEEDKVQYSTVVFTETPRPNAKQFTPKSTQSNSSSDEEVRTEYSQD